MPRINTKKAVEECMIVTVTFLVSVSDYLARQDTQLMSRASLSEGTNWLAKDIRGRREGDIAGIRRSRETIKKLCFDENTISMKAAFKLLGIAHSFFIISNGIRSVGSPTQLWKPVVASTFRPVILKSRSLSARPIKQKHQNEQILIETRLTIFIDITAVTATK